MKFFCLFQAVEEPIILLAFEDTATLQIGYFNVMRRSPKVKYLYVFFHVFFADSERQTKMHSTLLHNNHEPVRYVQR